MGINVDATISMTFAIGSGLAAVAGVLLEELQDDGPLTPDNRPRQKIIRNS